MKRIPQYLRGVLLCAQRNELRILFGPIRNPRLRRPKLDDTIKNAGIDLNHLYDPLVLGMLTKMTVAEDELFHAEPFGRRKLHYFRCGKLIEASGARYPRHIMPAGFTKTQTKARRGAQRVQARNIKRRIERTINRRERAKMQSLCEDLDARADAIYAALSHDADRTVADLMKFLERSRAFRDPADNDFLKGQSLRNAIIRELRKQPLSAMVKITQRKTQFGRPQIVVRRELRNSLTQQHGPPPDDPLRHRAFRNSSNSEEVTQKHGPPPSCRANGHSPEPPTVRFTTSSPQLLSN